MDGDVGGAHAWSGGSFQAGHERAVHFIGHGREFAGGSPPEKPAKSRRPQALHSGSCQNTN
jgi:hypothetical protein